MQNSFRAAVVSKAVDLTQTQLESVFQDLCSRGNLLLKCVSAQRILGDGDTFNMAYKNRCKLPTFSIEEGQFLRTNNIAVSERCFSTTSGSSEELFIFREFTPLWRELFEKAGANIKTEPAISSASLRQG